MSAPWFTSTETRSVTISHPRDPDATLEVTLRSLDSGDRAALEDAIAVESETDISIPLGTLKLLVVEKALVSWSLPEAVTPSTIRRLDPDVFEAIFLEVETGGGEVPPTNRAARRKAAAGSSKRKR